MARYRAGQANFSKGEISPAAEARFEIAVYNAAVRRALNVQVQRTGGLKKRMGTRFVAEAMSSSAYLIPFQFSDDQAYALEFAQAKMQPFALGGAVLETGLKITAITKEANAKISIANHGYAVGDPIYISSDTPATFGMVEILDRFLTVMSVPTSGTFTVNFDSRNATTFGSDIGQVNASAPPPPPPPPAVPPPAPSPPPPIIGGGGGGSYGGGGWNGPCLAIDSIYLLADGSEVEGRYIQRGTKLEGVDEVTLERRESIVLSVEFVNEDVYARAGWPEATGLHRFMKAQRTAKGLAQKDRWYTAGSRGKNIGTRPVVKLTTSTGTYIARHPADGSPWRVNHNVKAEV